MQTRSRSVALLLFDEVELLDFAAPVGVLTLAGRRWNFRPFAIRAVASRPGAIATRNQLRIEAAEPLDALRAPEVLLVPGGYGARRAAGDPQLVEWIRGAGHTAEMVLAVGSGLVPLGAAGLLDGIEVAATRELAELLAGVAPRALPRVGRALVDAGRVISAASAGAGIELGLAAVTRLLDARVARGVGAELGVASPADPTALAPPAVTIRDREEP